ncbi:MAG TPA: FAD-dependent oxidoreductase [Xanthobacteraceae bacterium]|jgi:pyruvate/2-oxoglutarate dehydrogenase complex dihydrolipoamide dehydrogenase (E3) component
MASFLVNLGAMAELLTPDLCVIGAGSGGLEAAAAGAALGIAVVLVEKGTMGGSWFNSGTVPATAMMTAVEHARSMARARPFGVLAAKIAVDFEKVHAHIESVKDSVAPNAWKERFIGLGVRVVEGAARFKGRGTVAVGEAIDIKARRFVIATGSLPASPHIDGLEAIPHLNEDTIFDLDRCPRHLIVIGAGPIGLELAQAFHDFGAKVTVLDAMRPLASEDSECARIVLDQLARDGIEVLAGVTVTRVEPSVSGIRVLFSDRDQERKIEATDLLVAAARRPNLDGLDLDRARIRHSKLGITVDPSLRTTNRRVYAIGDVIGGPRSTHAARYQASLAVRHALLRQPVRNNPLVVPRVIRTNPELAHVGLTDAEARRNGRICVLRWPFRENDRAQAERDLCGHIKVMTDRRGAVLGATIVGPRAGELIAIWSLAVRERLDVAALAGMIMPSSALAEIGKRAATTYLSAREMNPWMRRIAALLRRFR